LPGRLVPGTGDPLQLGQQLEHFPVNGDFLSKKPNLVIALFDGVGGLEHRVLEGKIFGLAFRRCRVGLRPQLASREFAPSARASPP